LTSKLLADQHTIYTRKSLKHNVKGNAMTKGEFNSDFRRGMSQY